LLTAAVARLWAWDNPGVAESNVELARRGFQAVLRGDVDALGALLAPEVCWHGGDPSAAGACRNRGEALAFIRRSELIQRGRFELIDAVGAGDKVVVIIRRSAEGDAEPSRVANLATFSDGKVIEMVHYPDPDDALAAAQRTDYGPRATLDGGARG
jgi:ketosteroid isomerase-like protein